MIQQQEDERFSKSPSIKSVSATWGGFAARNAASHREESDSSAGKIPEPLSEVSPHLLAETSHQSHTSLRGVPVRRRPVEAQSDWHCSVCGTKNFPSRERCRRCRQTKLSPDTGSWRVNLSNRPSTDPTVPRLGEYLVAADNHNGRSKYIKFDSRERPTEEKGDVFRAPQRSLHGQTQSLSQPLGQPSDSGTSAMDARLDAVEEKQKTHHSAQAIAGGSQRAVHSDGERPLSAPNSQGTLWRPFGNSAPPPTLRAATLPDVVPVQPVVASPPEISGSKQTDRASRARFERRRQQFGDADEELQIAQSYKAPAKRKDRRRQVAFYNIVDGGGRAYDELTQDRTNKKKPKKKKATSIKGEGAGGGTETKPQLLLPDFITVDNLAKTLHVRTEKFISQLEDMGFDAPRYDHILDAETSGLIAGEFNLKAVFGAAPNVQDLVARPSLEEKSNLPLRPPIVTIMGHVDHGKTTILDWLRKSSVVESEHGGITQHIGAFSVTMPGTNKQITFLDTPGHAAFLHMRRRGANVTDIVVLVVAADDSVKPQTIEAIKHAQEAKVAILVAVNKIDKEDANVERVKLDLSRHGLQIEEYDGDVQVIPVSGKTGQGMQDLEEATIALAEQADLRAEVDGPVEGYVIEAKVTPAGRVATVLVRRGTLRPGDFIVAGRTWARVRTLRNNAGTLLDEAPPSTPVEVDGWRGEDPSAGLHVLQADDEEHAKAVTELRLGRAETAKLTTDTAAINAARANEAEARAKVLAWEAEQEWARRKGRKPKDNEGWVEGVRRDGARQVHFVVKGDVAGSVEALIAAITAIGNNEIAANVIRSGVGPVAESDIQHLAATGETGYLVSFNQQVDNQMARLAQAAGVTILNHNIIYKVTDDVKEKLSEQLPPLITQRVLGEAEVGKIFEISMKKGKHKIAGCRISNGIISRDKKVRVLRNGDQVYNGTWWGVVPYPS